MRVTSLETVWIIAKAAVALSIVFLMLAVVIYLVLTIIHHLLRRFGG